MNSILPYIAALWPYGLSIVLVIIVACGLNFFNAPFDKVSPDPSDYSNPN